MPLEGHSVPNFKSSHANIPMLIKPNGRYYGVGFEETKQIASPPLQLSTPPSSGAWTPSDDHSLLAARAQGMNWAPVQQMYFPARTPNTCRKRHERLMYRRSIDDWDGLKLESLAKNYMGMRCEIWSTLAAQCGEKWSVVEQKVVFYSVVILGIIFAKHLAT
ncbi:hypothetical protein DL98DRAFT_433813 [Cadophora sp. DSE1049]|nr:hypothetical protein DL98DRAFT_433813 [Cadophora sp. DSE1049]